MGWGELRKKLLDCRGARSLANAQQVFDISWGLHSATRCTIAEAMWPMRLLRASVSSVAYAHTELACTQVEAGHPKALVLSRYSRPADHIRLVQHDSDIGTGLSMLLCCHVGMLQLSHMSPAHLHQW